MSSLAEFEEKFFAPESGVYDPHGVHHEFNQGLHGRKIDCDKIEEGTDLYNDWIQNKSKFIRAIYPPEILARAVLIGVANGSNRVARDVAAELGKGLSAIKTEKVKRGDVRLTGDGIEGLRAANPILGIVVEDVGNRGTTSATAVVSVHENRNPNLQSVEVVHTLIRGVPEWLAAINIGYHAMLDRKMKDYSPEECAAVGYCAYNWELIEYGDEQRAQAS